MLAHKAGVVQLVRQQLSGRQLSEWAGRPHSCGRGEHVVQEVAPVVHHVVAPVAAVGLHM